MKWFLILLILAGLGAGLWWYQSDIKSSDDIALEPATSKPDPSNATFIFEDGEVELISGVATTEIDGSSIVAETEIVGEPVYGDINNDKKNDAVLLLVQNSGGSGIFVYISSYVSGNVTYKGSNAVFIGDRISPQGISISSSGVITLNYLDRGPDEPMAATPTISTAKTFVFQNGKLEER